MDTTKAQQFYADPTTKSRQVRHTGVLVAA